MLYKINITLYSTTQNVALIMAVEYLVLFFSTGIMSDQVIFGSIVSIR